MSVFIAFLCDLRELRGESFFFHSRAFGEFLFRLGYDVISDTTRPR
jgi:hypothetical protein